MTINYDPRERYADKTEEVSMALDGLQARMWTMIPGKIAQFYVNNGAPYAEVEAMVAGRVFAPDGTVTFQNLPVLPHCPVLFPGGGGFSLTFPVTKGDECMLMFSSRSLDEWWQTSSVQPSYDLRMHDLSDGICVVGLHSNNNPIKNGTISQDTTQLRSEDGSTFVEVSSDTIRLHGKIILDGPVSATGDIVAQGDVTANGISVENHIHTNGNNGANTGKPVS